MHLLNHLTIPLYSILFNLNKKLFKSYHIDQITCLLDIYWSFVKHYLFNLTNKNTICLFVLSEQHFILGKLVLNTIINLIKLATNLYNSKLYVYTHEQKIEELRKTIIYIVTALLSDFFKCIAIQRLPMQIFDEYICSIISNLSKFYDCLNDKNEFNQYYYKICGKQLYILYMNNKNSIQIKRLFIYISLLDKDNYINTIIRQVNNNNANQIKLIDNYGKDDIEYMLIQQIYSFLNVTSNIWYQSDSIEFFVKFFVHPIEKLSYSEFYKNSKRG